LIAPSSGLLPTIDGPEAFVAAFDVSHETIDRLTLYETLLKRWQKAVNLVAPATLDQVWHRHFADSAQLVALAPAARIWLDLGTGAGFPGMVIAILLANRPNVSVHLVESNARKCAFLREVARQTGTSVEIHQTRIESLAGVDRVIRPDVIVARALSPLPKLLGQALPFFGPATRALFLKGRTVDAELDAAQERYVFDWVMHSSRTDPGGRIVEIAALRKKEEA
jgi:16S rRNA (guanine527-N7)-methyltransferase